MDTLIIELAAQFPTFMGLLVLAAVQFWMVRALMTRIDKLTDFIMDNSNLDRDAVEHAVHGNS